MRNELIAPLHQWLKELTVAVPARYLQQKLAAHPEYPSLASITDVLDDLGLDNGAYVVNRNDWNDLPTPFLAHLNDQQGKLVIVHKDDQRELSQGGKLAGWTGIAVFAEKPAGWRNVELNDYLLRQRKVNTYWILSLSLLLLSGIAVLIPVFSVASTFLLLSAFAGLGLSVLVIQKESGISNELTEKLCGVQSDEGCAAVIESKGSKISGSFSWSDAGIIYFSAYTLLLLNGSSLLPILTASAIPFLFFSVYYQWKVIRRWCTLCLLTLGVIGIQFALLWPSLITMSFHSITISTVALAVAVCLMSAIVWRGVIKPLLEENQTVQEEKFRLQRFRHNSGMFQALLRQQPKAEVSAWEDDLQLGNADSPLQFVVACNPYCGPCAKTHEVLHKLADRQQVGVTVRFTSNPVDKADPRTAAVAYLLQLASGRSAAFKKEMLHDWYRVMDLEQFSMQYPDGRSVDVAHAVQQHQQWIDEARVAVTPTIFLNGHVLPKEYTAEDLLILVRGMHAGVLSANEVPIN
ncbi:hypothetical protein LZZ85_00465 [Terrimonas sp. NA20]|uniref:Vitamin K epoxide reductase domain-containing protein n=1 Tax=Terrimonas ginsenosidimutans TaxID=2908004 RepID=A0ABS9KK82_9BACT|nr:vitamin K epoxide reductase family protein [Terrimonas ginsenosidimutans]MCG2612723.1 hypothetical protein [Terrimonas ginsenosidimutans]